MSWLVSGLTCVTASVAAQDRITLTNGDTLSGQIRSASDATISLDTELVGAVIVKWTDISRVASTTSIRATFRNDQSVEGTLNVVDGTVSIRLKDGTTRPIATAEIRTVQGAGTSMVAANWHSSVSADLALSRGNSETSTLTASGRVTRLGRRDKTGIFGSYVFSTVGSGADAVTTARGSRGGARYDHDIVGPLYGFGFSDAENDPLQLLDLRLVLGGGIGTHLLNTTASQLNVFGGLSYARDAYVEQTSEPTATTIEGSTTGPPVTPPGQGGTPPGRSGVKPTRGGTPPSVVRTSLSRSLTEFVVGHDLTHQLSSGLSVSESFAIFPAIGDFQDYRVSFDVTLWAQINAWLQWNLNVSDRYLHIPPAGGAVQNDTFVSTGLGITFGRTDVGGFGGADRPNPRR